MTKLLEIKDQLIRFYSKYETYLYPIVKFAVALALFTVINTNIGLTAICAFCDSMASVTSLAVIWKLLSFAKNYTKGPYSRVGKSGPFFFALI